MVNYVEDSAGDGVAVVGAKSVSAERCTAATSEHARRSSSKIGSNLELPSSARTNNRSSQSAAMAIKHNQQIQKNHFHKDW